MTRTTPRRLMTLHRSHIGFTLALTFTTLSLCPEPVSYSSPAQVVGAQLHLHPVARQYPDVVHPHLARDVREHVVPALELDPKLRVGQSLGDGAFDLYDVFFGQGPPISNRYKMAGAKRISYHACPVPHTPKGRVSPALTAVGGEHPRAVLGDGQGVLEMGRERAVRGVDRPPVPLAEAYVVATERDHGLYREGHPGKEPRPGARPAVVGDLRVLVHLAPDPVGDEVPYDAVAPRLGQLLYGVADVPEVVAGARLLGGRLQAPPGGLAGADAPGEHPQAGGGDAATLAHRLQLGLALADDQTLPPDPSTASRIAAVTSVMGCAASTCTRIPLSA